MRALVSIWIACVTFVMAACAGEPVSAVDQWMIRQKQKNPADYERLQNLRQQDPVAFKMELTARLQRQMQQNTKTPAATNHMARQDRKTTAPNKGVNVEDPISVELEARRQDLVRQYHACVAPAQRAELFNEIRRCSVDLFERRQKQRRQMLEEAKQRTITLERDIDRMDQEREQIIAQRIEKLINSGKGSHAARDTGRKANPTDAGAPGNAR